MFDPPSPPPSLLPPPSPRIVWYRVPQCCCWEFPFPERRRTVVGRTEASLSSGGTGGTSRTTEAVKVCLVGGEPQSERSSPRILHHTTPHHTEPQRPCRLPQLCCFSSSLSSQEHRSTTVGTTTVANPAPTHGTGIGQCTEPDRTGTPMQMLFVCLFVCWVRSL